MAEAHEQLEHAEHAEHAGGVNKKIALMIAVMALFLAFSETLGKSANTEAKEVQEAKAIKKKPPPEAVKVTSTKLKKLGSTTGRKPFTRTWATV